MVDTERKLMQMIKYPPFIMSKMEQKLQSYLLDNISAIGHLSIVQLESGAGVSKSTISRFCRRMGTSSFREFTTTLAQEAVLYYANIHITAKPGEDMSEIARKLCVLECETLQETFTNFNYQTMDEVTEKLLSASSIHVFSSGGAVAVAMDFHHKMLRLGLNVMLHQELIHQKMQAQMVDEDDLAFIFTFSGEDQAMLDVADTVKMNGAFVVAVTNGIQSSLAGLADATLAGANRENFVYTGTIESRLSLMYILDLMFILTSMRGAPDTTDMLSKTKSVLDETKIAKNKTLQTKGKVHE